MKIHPNNPYITTYQYEQDDLLDAVSDMVDTTIDSVAVQMKIPKNMIPECLYLETSRNTLFVTNFIDLLQNSLYFYLTPFSIVAVILFNMYHSYTTYHYEQNYFYLYYQCFYLLFKIGNIGFICYFPNYLHLFPFIHSHLLIHSIVTMVLQLVTCHYSFKYNANVNLSETLLVLAHSYTQL